jgi:hypothetical protein
MNMAILLSFFSLLVSFRTFQKSFLYLIFNFLLFLAKIFASKKIAGQNWRRDKMPGKFSIFKKKCKRHISFLNTSN